jgi:hypothetical protein
MPKAPSPTPDIAGMAGAPGAWATCPAKTLALWCANIVTPALPAAPPVYSHTIPPPAVAVWTKFPNETPSAVFAWVRVGHVDAPVVAAPVVGVFSGGAEVADAVVVGEDVGEVVGEEVGLALGLPLPDPQPVSPMPTTRTPMAQDVRLCTAMTIRPCPSADKRRGRTRGMNSVPTGLTLSFRR